MLLWYFKLLKRESEMIKIVFKRPSDYPDGIDTPDRDSHTEFTIFYDGEKVSVEAFGFYNLTSRMIAPLNHLTNLPCEAQNIFISTSDGIVTISGEIWVWEEETRSLLEEVLADLEANLSVIAQKYPTSTFLLKYHMTPKL